MTEVDALVVGGGPGGLTAALMLGRARRSVLVVDASEGRNRFAAHSHSFFTRDGTPPPELRAIGREQALAYPDTRHHDGSVVSLTGSPGAFNAVLDDGTAVTSRVVVLATGAVDVLQPIEGIDRYWGRGVFQCPFCDGWENRDRPMAVLTGEEQALMIVRHYYNWGHDLTLLTNGRWEPDSALRASLDAMAVPVRTDEIAEVEGDGEWLGGVRFASGERLPLEIIWTRPTPKVRNELAVGLGCELVDKGGFSGFVWADETSQTSVPGVYAVGDLTNAAPSVAFAVSSASFAAARANHLLVELDHEHVAV
ncbi:MAG: NAD(P)/FAD-dependent oxidoreductase [Chloroflexota bacterium]|nr:NAD(P)/FAD-dependent oxidoreductase [Chloroflexota bacterium]